MAGNLIRTLIAEIGHCRAGDECQFLHDGTRLPGTAAAKPTHEMPESSTAGNAGQLVTDDGLVQDRRQAVTKPVPNSRVVPKPIPQAQTQDPREFQLGQIRRRFKPKETKHGLGTTQLKFSLAPSDPDFPFEMTALECLLSVPAAYPKEGPSLKVGNTDIPRGFALNVEHGFATLVEEKPGSSLLDLLKALDKSLEVFLSAPKAETVKLMPNKDTRHLSVAPSRSVEPAAGLAAEKAVIATSSVEKVASRPAEPIMKYTAQEKAEASKRREIETRQLEARMKRLPLYKMSPDGIAFTLPIEPKKRSELPLSLQEIKAVALFVPLLYPLQPCRAKLEGLDVPEAKPVEDGFLLRATDQKHATLTGHVNYLAQNMHLMAKTKLETKTPARSVQDPVVEGPAPESSLLEGQQDPERGHIQYITRPPEWTIIGRDEASDSDDFDSYDTGDETSDEDGGGVEVQEEKEVSEQPKQPSHNPERGTAISFPFMELYGIEILEIVTLNITVKCERCKSVTEVRGLKDSGSKSESCKKCSSPLSVNFRKDLVHAHAVRAGFLDLEGCVVGDMLASTFVPTCSQCSTAYPTPGIISVQGEATSNICRSCHQKITFKIPSVKFLRITSSSAPAGPGPRRKRETLGLTPGSELPKRGRCRHYTKSYRWFRFSCCLKVYACDKCHEEGEEHSNEWANRMICGHCSREQNYRPEDCAVCHGSLVGRKSSGGFWEGGKGTRDKVRMSRKDKRKFRRVGGGRPKD
ncbi:CHY zinc finger protein [Diplocarpon rosae]|nr:CHY zinc finger protein [Diplocarpon rosae]